MLELLANWFNFVISRTSTNKALIQLIRTRGNVHITGVLLGKPSDVTGLGLLLTAYKCDVSFLAINCKKRSKAKGNELQHS